MKFDSTSPDGKPVWFVKDGPGKYDLFICGLLEGHSVRFSIGRSSGPARAYTALVSGARVHDPRNAIWYIEILVRLDVESRDERVLIFYDVRHKNGHVVAQPLKGWQSPDYCPALPVQPSV